jgi:hypothetical protein
MALGCWCALVIETTREFNLRACDREFLITADAECSGLIAAAFSGLARSASSQMKSRPPSYHVARDRLTSGFRVDGPDNSRLFLETADALVFHIDKELILGLQHRRPDLFFLHAAVIEVNGRTAVFPAASGAGKSTFALAMLGRGAAYLSDELAPINVPRLSVHPFPHALCLKSIPPPPCQLPAGTVRAGKRLYVPTGRAASEGDTEKRLSAFFFLTRGDTGPTRGETGICRQLSTAAATAHLIANALNLRAHDGNGLEPALLLAQTVPAYQLRADDLTHACQAVEGILKNH